MARKQAFPDLSASLGSPTATVEDYLQGIWILNSRGEPAIGARLAEWLAVKPPTVTKMLQRMVRDGLITMDRHKHVHLTKEGRMVAERLVRRHRVLERFLTDVLGLRWHEVHPEAHRLEHAISALVEERMMAMMGRPATCPHGNPIPGEPQPDLPVAVPLTRLEVGAHGRIQRIAEEAEDDLELMVYLEDAGLVPGTTIEVVDVAPLGDTLTLSVAGSRVTLGARTAAYIWAAEIAQDQARCEPVGAGTSAVREE